MRKKISASRSCFTNVLCILCVHLIVIAVAGNSVRAQTAQTLAQVKKVSVESFGQDHAAREVRESLVEGLRTTGKLTIVADSKQADAIINGTCSIWITGYFSTDVRNPAAMSQPSYQGFLSVEMVGKDSEPLWSYLVTPSEFRTKSITQDLASRMLRKLVEALQQQNEEEPKSAVDTYTTEMTLKAAGIAFPAPVYEEWFESFQERHRNVHIFYQPVGSRAGIKMLMQRKVDFAASDMPLSESNVSLLHFATVLGAVVPVYNLKDVDDRLNFTGEVLAGIYLGQIRNWNDPKIRKFNEHIRLPNSRIVVIHRSDESGSTLLWTEYLSKGNPEWKAAVGAGSVVKWPVGEAAEGNEAVAKLVQKTPNSIGYVGLVYALRHQLNFGAVRNVAGEFVHADLDSVTAAAKGATIRMTSDFSESTMDSRARDAYPIVGFTWWLRPPGMEDGEKKTALIELLQWVLTSGQRECSALAYAPLPRDMANQELEFLNTLR